LARRSTFELSVGELLSQSFGIYFRNLIPFLLLGMVATAPWLALQIYSKGVDPRSQLPINIVSLILQFVMGQLLAGALCFGVIQQLRGEKAGIGQVLSHGLASLFRVMGTGLLVGLLVAAGTVILLVPGLWLTVRFFIAIPVTVMEGKGGGAALERSSALVRDNGWKVFGALLLLGTAYLIVLIAGFVLWMPAGWATAETPPELPLAFPATISVVGGTFYSTLMAVAYFQLRMGKENLDAGQVAAVFG
jgi:hypothetical protein